MDWHKAFAKTLAQAMRARGEDVHRMAASSQVGGGTITNLLNAEPVDTPTSTLAALAEALGMDLEVRLVSRAQGTGGGLGRGRVHYVH